MNIPNNTKVGKTYPKLFGNIQVLYPFLVTWDTRVNYIQDFFSLKILQKLEIP